MFVVFVFDGLRPDLVQPEVMPRLCGFRESGMWFERSHCVFPSVTRVNASSLATGSYPATHGIPANTVYIPELSPERPLRTTGDIAVLRLQRGTDAAPLLNVETLIEALARQGHRTVTVGTGSPGSTLLLDPHGEALDGALYHHTFTRPHSLHERVLQRLGPAPAETNDHAVEPLTVRVRYAARALTEVLVPEVEPSLALFWCTIPDALHHSFGLGSPEAISGLRAVDAIFGELVDDLERIDGVAPNVIVTADHGYVSVDRIIAVNAALDGVFARCEARPVVAVDGGALHLYFGGQPADLAPAVDELLRQDWVAGVLSRRATPGALPLSAVGLDTPRAADLIATLAWRDGDNGRGVNGLADGSGGIAAGMGDHGGGSPFEMRNTLLAFGPAFAGGTSSTPAGIVDVAPTVCAVLGVAAPKLWDGRVLTEALSGGTKIASREEIAHSSSSKSGQRTQATVACAGPVRYVTGISRTR
ncbi:MAG: alkaline phosphatase family protein [Dehalococcoidia bacterium]